MKTRVEDGGTCRKRLFIELEPDEIRNELDSTYSDLAANAQLPGFRKGHAPRKGWEQYYKL